jgi:hypothetical protein
MKREIDIEKYRVLLVRFGRNKKNVEDRCNNFQYGEN